MKLKRHIPTLEDRRNFALFNMKGSQQGKTNSYRRKKEKQKHMIHHEDFNIRITY